MTDGARLIRDVKRYRLRHDDAFYGPMKGALCACRECQLLDELVAELAAAGERERELREAVEDYLLWEPGRRGHAEAHRKLAEAATKSDRTEQA